MASRSSQERLARRDQRSTDAVELARINRHAVSLNAEAMDVLEYQGELSLHHAHFAHRSVERK
jgi:hypothetical protein